MTSSRPNGLEAYTVILLRHGQQVLLLQRAATKAFMPERWTGIGGRVEAGEFGDLRSSALRELREETGLTGEDIDHFLLRRALLVARPGKTLTALLYFTAFFRIPLLPDCTEGTLAWVPTDQVDALDVIESTRPVLPLLVEDMECDPAGIEPVKIGLGIFNPDGTFDKVEWGS